MDFNDAAQTYWQPVPGLTVMLRLSDITHWGRFIIVDILQLRGELCAVYYNISFH